MSDRTPHDASAADGEPDTSAWWSRPSQQDPYAAPAGGQAAGGGSSRPGGDAAYQDAAYQDRAYQDGAYQDGGHRDAAYQDGGSGDGGYGRGSYADGGSGEGSYGLDGYAAPQGAPAYSAQGSVQPVYAPPSGAAPQPAQDPWGAPAPASGANAWGYPTDTLGTPAPRPSRGSGRGRRLAVAAVLASGLLGGITGGALVAVGEDDGGLTDPAASLGSVSPEQSVDRAPESVAGIAGRVLRSTVSISVRTASGEGSGSGVVLRQDGYVLTNNHVVAAGGEGGRITVTVNGGEGRELAAQIVGLDPETDLAVLKVDGGGTFVPATLGRSSDLVVGDPVVAIGSPLGLNGTVTTGIVSALNRTVNVPGEDGQQATPLLNAIQTDAAINPGNSGGALVNGQGAVIGINSAIATLGATSSGDTSGSIGVGFAIPVDEARSVAEEIIRTGRATHPAIGVEAGNEVADDGRKAGARLTRILSGSPAAAGGLRVGDVVDKVQDIPVGSVDELILALRQSKVGDRVTVEYLRDGQRGTAELELADKAAN